LRLDEKVVLVTGSTRGIGKAIAMKFAEEGASVIVNASKHVEEAEKTLSALTKGKAQEHCFIKADIRDFGQISEMMKKIDKQYGRLDILINNAGKTRFVKHEKLEDMTPDLFDGIYGMHLKGPFMCVEQALSMLKKSQDAQVINIASIAAITAVGSNIAYCAMKAALVNMTKSLARALAPDVRVNAISPGLTETGLIKDWEKYKSEQLDKTPLGRLGTCEDVANAALVLASSLKYVTGQNLIVDGGRTLE